MTVWLTYILLGALAGVLAGLLGVGGGIVIVPALVFIFTAQNLPEQHILHLALGTSLATIMFTSLSSLKAHHLRGGVDWHIVKGISTGIILGTFGGSWIAAQLSTRFLKISFVIFLFFVAFQMLLDMKPKPHRQIPGTFALFGFGTIIGSISALVGIGGGSMSVPFLVWCNTELRRAIGTSAAIGFPIALSGTIGYVINGWSATLPANTFGFIYLPALMGVAATSYITAPIGAKLAHFLPVSTLKKIFAIMLVVMGTKMLMGLF